MTRPPSSPPHHGSDTTAQALLQRRLADAREPDAEEQVAMARLGAELRRRMFNVRGEPQRLGRYIVLGPVGRGGLGIVVSAYDPQLDRRVAIKRLRPRSALTLSTDDLRLQLVGEAQALAQLSHPNIVEVLDVGVDAEEPFVVMELVSGVDLAQWIAPADGPRPWRDVVRIFADAARGLAAAHSIGIIHGDFKPANALLRDDGRTCVADFGLARLVGLPCESPTTAGPPIEPRLAIGTPAYLAPECHDGAPASVRSDVYAFFTALFEALHGARPFRGTAAEIVAAKRRGPPVPRRSLPTPLRAALARGLAPDPSDRHRDMATVAALLDAVRRRRSRVSLVAAAAVLAAVLAAVTAASVLAVDGPGEPVCARESSGYGALWDDEKRSMAARALSQTGSPLSAQTWARLEPRLRARVDEIATLTEQQCGRATPSGWETDPVRACLRRRAAETTAIVELLVGHTQAPDVHTILPALDRLALPSICRHAGRRPAVETTQQTDPLEERVRQPLFRANALRGAGKFAEAARVIAPLRAQAEASTNARLTAEVLALHGSIRSELGDHVAAADDLMEAARIALGEHDVEAAASAAIALTLVVGAREAQFEEGLRWAARAQALLGAHDLGEDLAGHAANNLANIHLARGDHAAAVTGFERARDQLRGIYGSEHSVVATVTMNIGSALGAAGRFAEAETELRRARRSFARALGEDHPTVAMVMGNLGQLLLYRGDRAQGHRVASDALALAQRSLGPDNPALALHHARYAQAEFAFGRLESAEFHLRRAVALYDDGPPGHPELLAIRGSLAAVLAQQGRYAESEDTFRNLLAVQREQLGDDHPHVAVSIGNIASVRRERGDLDAALAGYRRALEIAEASVGASHPLATGFAAQRADVLEALAADRANHGGDDARKGHEPR